MIAFISSVLGGKPFKAISSMFEESPQESVRGTTVDLLVEKDEMSLMSFGGDSKPSGATDGFVNF